MSDVYDGSDGQPMPIHNDGPSMHDLVRDDLLERKAFGLRKYGTPLQAHNGRDPLKDLYDELLDAVVYTRQLIEERSSKASESSVEDLSYVNRGPDGGTIAYLKDQAPIRIDLESPRVKDVRAAAKEAVESLTHRFMCKLMPTRNCPKGYISGCGDRPCARFESDVEDPWLEEMQ